MDTQIEELLTRSVANIIPSKESLLKKLSSGDKLNIYMGIDPTATRIHLGHVVTLRFLQKFAELGHNVTFLVGDFTALIGDTSDKESERPQLTREQIEENVKTYKSQAEKVLDFSKISIRYNSEWLEKLTFADIVKLTQKFSLGDFISRELIKKRLTEGKKIGLHEILYPVMQGYDSLYLDTDLQIGGTDQTFNMQAGRNLIKSEKNKESFVLTNVFLTGTDGRKMSKTWDNAIWIEDNPSNMYGKVMSLKDDLIIEYFTLATEVLMDEIETIKQDLTTQNPMEIKKKLAYTITKQLHGEKAAENAAQSFQNVVQNKELPFDVPVITVSDSQTSFVSIALKQNLVDSNSDWKRMVEQGAVSFNDRKITNPFLAFSENGILKVGKRNLVKIIKS